MNRLKGKYNFEMGLVLVVGLINTNFEYGAIFFTIHSSLPFWVAYSYQLSLARKPLSTY